MNNDFLDVITTKLINKKLSKQEKQIICFFAENFYTFFEDEIEPPSSMITLMTTICGNKYPQVISSSINSFGEKHFCFESMVDSILNEFEGRHNGFGHPKYKDGDPRVQKVLDFMKKIKYQKKSNVEFVENENANLNYFSQNYGNKPLSLNIGGLLTAFLLDVGFDKYNIGYIPIIIRMIGMTNIYQKAKKKNIKFGSSHEAAIKYNKANKF